MNTLIKYCTYSDTIRVMPQNYCLLFMSDSGAWTLYFDSAIEPDILHKTLDFLLIHENKFQRSGEVAARDLNEYLNK